MVTYLTSNVNENKKKILFVQENNFIPTNLRVPTPICFIYATRIIESSINQLTIICHKMLNLKKNTFSLYLR